MECTACPDDGMQTDPGATSWLDCECPRGTFVFGYGDPSKVHGCRDCDSDMQLCDETHQAIPKPSGPGIWIDPIEGSAHTCEPYASCIQHKTVEDVLLGECTEGYQVRLFRILRCPSMQGIDKYG